ncbi:serine-rich adhesin for platelets isoform X1 [Drosophila tropicalis]|uniref:serine-rich adhesin for platelets isoform X1 n=2 Tax=Drosophila tropicalis TaxID=46794 RepID=UPI0035ABFAE0
MLSAELTPSTTVLLNASYQPSNGLTKDEVFLSTTTYETSKPPGATTATEAAAETGTTTMTKQLTSTTATNAASSITQAGNLAPTVISPTSGTNLEVGTAPGTATATETAVGVLVGGISAATDNTTKRTTTAADQQQQQSTIATTATTTTATATTTTTNTNDASGRSAALERAYVHDVYEHCEEPTGPVRPRVAQFLGNLEPGSVVCDVGCGSGRYLTQCNPAICTIGVDRCYRLSKVAHEKGGEVALCDNLELPFRDDSFDAVLSLAVVHHFATTERRVRALRELARILRIGGRVVITVWALEQRHRRFESQDVLIPWQPPKNRTFTYSDEDEEDDFLPPYHAYTEDSTNSSRSAGDGDSSSLSSSSPGESCYSFVRRAIQKLAGGRRHAWFLDSWTSKDTKNDSSLDYEDAKDLPIELRRLEDFEDFPDPPLSAALKSRSLGSILQPPPRQIVRSRSSVPSLGGPLLPGESKATAAAALLLNAPDGQLNGRHSPTTTASAGNTLSRRPKLIKQKQSLCEDDNHVTTMMSSSSITPAYQMLSNYNSSNGGVTSSLYTRSGCYASNFHQHASSASAVAPNPVPAGSSANLRKQSSLNEDLMACNRLREKERVRKRIQKQTSLNEAFLCRSAVFSKRLQVIREGLTTKIKSSTGSLERVTKTGISKIIQNIKNVPQPTCTPLQPQAQMEKLPSNNNNRQIAVSPHQLHQHHHHHHHHLPHLVPSNASATSTSSATLTGPVSYCSSSLECSLPNVCHCSQYQQECAACADSEQGQTRRHSRESGSDSSKDSSLQSDTSIESEDSFASVIFIPKPEQHQQQLNYQQQHQNSNSSSSNSSSSNGQAKAGGTATNNAHSPRQPPTMGITTPAGAAGTTSMIHSVPTSPLIMPCPPTPAHSPAATQGTVTSPPQTMAAVSAAMAILTPPTKPARFNFDEAHIKQQNQQQLQQQQQIHKITRQTIRDLPPIPKFRKQQSLPMQRQAFPIIRRASGSGSSTTAALGSKLLSLELFNPATDDLDSDSSEPSSPDSIDSVISAPRSAQLASGSGEKTGTTTTASADENDDLASMISRQQEQYHKGELQINNASIAQDNDDDIILNSDSAPLLPERRQSRVQDCADFAEKLSAQLQRELEDKCNRSECRSLDGIGDLTEYLASTASSSAKKRSNGDLSSLREELRERRLMLANLSTQPSLQQSPISSSTSSLSSQTRSFTIHEEDGEEEEGVEEEDENEPSFSLGIYEHCKISKFNYKRNRHYQLNPETAYLLQDDGDSDVRDEEEEEEDEVTGLVGPIPEEEEDAEALEARGGDQLGEGMLEYGQRQVRRTIGAIKQGTPSTTTSASTPTTAAVSPSSGGNATQTIMQQRQQPPTSTDSLEHSNSSTNSLDSPSQGGASTHHRYYHVFREGELDALINHHVSSLHIVSSYYERASWCVVAEKVQVWTI